MCNEIMVTKEQFKKAVQDTASLFGKVGLKSSSCPECSYWESYIDDYGYKYAYNQVKDDTDILDAIGDNISAYTLEAMLFGMLKRVAESIDIGPNQKSFAAKEKVIGVFIYFYTLNMLLISGEDIKRITRNDWWKCMFRNRKDCIHDSSKTIFDCWCHRLETYSFI